MIKIESGGSSNKKSKRIGTTTITFVLAFSVAAFVASGVSYGAKPSTPTALNAMVCNRIGGVWSANTCTINETTSSLVSSGFKIYNGVVLDIKGGLTINPGVTIANAGAIIVENSGGVIPNNPLHDWETGLLVYGTLRGSIRCFGCVLWGKAPRAHGAQRDGVQWNRRRVERQHLHNW